MIYKVVWLFHLLLSMQSVPEYGLVLKNTLYHNLTLGERE